MRIALTLALSCVTAFGGLIINQSSLNHPLKTVVTDASTTPTTNQTIVSAGWNGLRVWTGEQDVTEAYFDLYVRINGGTATKYRTFRFGGRIITATSGDSVSLGTSNGRTLYVTPMYTPTTTETISGTTGTANCDKAGPPLWAPTAAHVTLPANARAFKINSSGTELDLFISEFDGSAWTPVRWMKVEANRSATVRTSYRKIALANYAGTTVSITSAPGTIVGGTMTTMSLTFPPVTGTSRSVSTVSEFMTAVAAAVAGDEIVFQDGTYTMTNTLTHNSFVANEAVGNRGSEGIIFRSASGNRDACILSRSANTNGGWNLDCYGNTGKTTWFKDLTYDGNCSTSTDADLYGLRFYDGSVSMQNVRVTGTNLINGDAESVLYFLNRHNNSTVNVDLVFCQFDNQSGRVLSNSGFQTNSPTGNGSVNPGTRRAIACDVFTGSTTAAQQLIATYYKTDFEFYGGSVYDSATYAAGGARNAVTWFFFTSFPQASTTARSKNYVDQAAMFGCNWTGYAGTIMPTGPYDANSRATYLVFNRFTQINSSGSFWFLGNSSSTGYECSHNFFQALTGVAQQNFYGGSTFNFNIVTNAGTGIRSAAYSGAQTTAYVAIGNTIDHCTTAVFSTNNAFTSTFKNNATTTSTAGFSTTSTGMAAITANYNVFDPTTSGYVAGASDITNANAQVDSYYFPTASGNCDGNGDTSAVDWVGGSDPWGLVLIYKPTRVSRGAREIPAVYSGANLYPDIW